MPRPSDVVFPPGKERYEERRRERQNSKLQDEFFDHATLLAVGRLVTRGLFDTLDYPVATGKEGGVFRATGAGGYRAVKVYRIGNSIFRSLPAHVMESFRQEASARNFGQLVTAWTRREHTILGRFHDAGVHVPVPYGYDRNVLAMDYVGDGEGRPAPKLHDAVMADPTAAWGAILEQMRLMLTEAKYVHGDLSPYNVLWLDEEPVIIDVAQAVPRDHPQALELLDRDVRNFAKYFERLGVDAPFLPAWDAIGGARLAPRRS
jgi:RIO kinase 1